MRKAFSDTLVSVADKNPKLVFVTGDLGFGVFDEFQSKFGARYINAGVAEAQMINSAAGLASEGFHPVAYSIASFATGRPLEQIRYCVAYPNLPVTLVGAGRGLTYANAGVSHHALDDIALMSAIPNMTVVIPGDPGEVETLFPQVAELPGPSYFTVGRFGEPRYEAEEPAILGKARLLRQGEGIAVVTMGETAGEVLEACKLLKPDKISPIVYQIHTVKPLDTHTLDSLAQRVGTIIIVEEHLPMGGLWSAVAQWRASLAKPLKLVRLGPPDAFALGNLTRTGFRRSMEFDAEAIAKACRKLSE